MNPQALYAAMQALTSAVTGLTQQIIATNNQSQRQQQPTPGTQGSSTRGTVGSMWGMVLGKFTAILGPLALLGEVLKAPIAGFEILAKSAKLVSLALAPVLLPATVLISTALVALAEVVTGSLAPVFENLFSIVLGLGIPVIIGFIDGILDASRQLEQFAKDLGISKVTAQDVSKYGGYLRDIVQWGIPGQQGNVIARRSFKEITGRDLQDKNPINGTTIVQGALRDVIQSLRNSIGPKANIGTIEGVAKSIQLAALNIDPIEARMVRIQERILVILENAVRETLGGPVTGTAK